MTVHLVKFLLQVTFCGSALYCRQTHLDQQTYRILTITCCLEVTAAVLFHIWLINVVFVSSVLFLWETSGIRLSTRRNSTISASLHRCYNKLNKTFHYLLILSCVLCYIVRCCHSKLICSFFVCLSVCLFVCLSVVEIINLDLVETLGFLGNSWTSCYRDISSVLCWLISITGHVNCIMLNL